MRAIRLCVRYANDLGMFAIPSDVVPDNVLVGGNVERYAAFVGRKERNIACGGRGRGRGQKY